MKNSILLFLFLSLGYSVIAQEQDDVYSIVEEMPLWKGCESESSLKAGNECTVEKIKKYVGDEVKKNDLKKKHSEGMVFVGFIIDEEGSVSEVEVLRGIAKEPKLDKIAIKIIESMPQFIPGKQRGKAVKVKYIVPVKFKNAQ